MRVLIVDDEPYCNAMVRKFLEMGEIETYCCFNVDEAIEAINTQDTFDIVITDIIMPVQHGTKLIEYLADINYPAPVIAITAGFENAVDDYVFYAEMLADAALAKPLKREELIKTVENLTAA